MQIMYEAKLEIGTKEENSYSCGYHWDYDSEILQANSLEELYEFMAPFFIRAKEDDEYSVDVEDIRYITIHNNQDFCRIKLENTEAWKDHVEAAARKAEIEAAKAAEIARKKAEGEELTRQRKEAQDLAEYQRLKAKFEG